MSFLLDNVNINTTSIILTETWCKSRAGYIKSWKSRTGYIKSWNMRLKKISIEINKK